MERRRGGVSQKEAVPRQQLPHEQVIFQREHPALPEQAPAEFSHPIHRQQITKAYQRVDAEAKRLAEVRAALAEEGQQQR